PKVVTVTFDSPVFVGPRNAAVRNDGTDVQAAPARVTGGRTIVIPLRRNLPSGDYSVRWSVVSEDGHPEEGVLAFGVGTTGTPVAVLTPGGVTTWQRGIMRAVLFLGILPAAGAAFFSLFVLGGALPRPQRFLLSGAFIVAFVGADALIHVTAA